MIENMEFVRINVENFQRFSDNYVKLVSSQNNYYLNHSKIKNHTVILATRFKNGQNYYFMIFHTYTGKPLSSGHSQIAGILFVIWRCPLFRGGSVCSGVNEME